MTPEPAARTGGPGREGSTETSGRWPIGPGGPERTEAGDLRLVPVRLERDLPLLTGWMNSPAVDAFWKLGGPVDRTAAHLRPQLEPGSHSLPCLGVLDGRPVSYWEIYRAERDPLARHYSCRPGDLGLHLLVGEDTDRGRGLGTALLRGVCRLVLRHAPDCRRLVAEPDAANAPSLAVFRKAGFRAAEELRLPDKRAVLMIRER
ncbi:GNAT family N-acetyltransferase [Streptomyces sodiiphilus]|uniref:Lysine N-acyltransferase MbtK n=1 Tax=Streptomyces sodiiphilus TaxID=226217 RepID=A0ABP5AV46_9ACTN